GGAVLGAPRAGRDAGRRAAAPHPPRVAGGALACGPRRPRARRGRGDGPGARLGRGRGRRAGRSLARGRARGGDRGAGRGGMTLRLRDRVIEIDRPLVMGIVNASPESFSDGASVGGLDEQVERALSLGADIVDVGGESGVTGMPPLAPSEEAARVVPLVERVVRSGLLVSVDTWQCEFARAVLDAGAAMINDV